MSAPHTSTSEATVLTVPTVASATAVRAARFSGFILAGLLVAGLVSCGLLLASGKVTLLPPTVARDAVLRGEITHKIAKQLSNAWLPEQAARLERGASWLLFHDTGARVRAGCPGWLFLNDELLVNRQAQINADTKARAVIDIQQRLAARGIKLLVAVVPDKSRIAAEQLCGLRRPASLATRAADWADGLHKAGVPVLDLAATLQPLGAAAYLRTDTHWNERGARAAAEAIAPRVRQLGIAPVPQRHFTVQEQAAARRPGDLVHLAGIDWLPLRWQPTPEMVSITEVSEVSEVHEVSQGPQAKGGDDLDDLLGDDNLPNIALIGTSFSRNSNFVGFLQLALGAPIGSFAKDGGEFSASANAYFSNPAFRQTPPQLLIWEIPERDLQTPYEAINWPAGGR